MNKIINRFISGISKRAFLTFIASLLLLSVFAGVFAKVINFQTVWVDDILFASDYYEQYDDRDIVIKIFTTSVYFDEVKYLYRPVFILSFYLDSKLSSGQINFEVNHITSLLLHLMCVLLLFNFLIKYCHFNLWLSLIASIIFAVNVFSVWSAAWLSGRCDLLLFLFSFSSLIFFIKSNEEKNYVGRQIFLLFHFILFFAALLSKETAVVLPILCITYSFIKKYKVRPAYSVYFFIYALYFVIYSNEISVTQRIISSFDIQNMLYIISDYFSCAFLLSKSEMIPAYDSFTVVKGSFIIIVLFLLALSNFKKNKEALFFLAFAVLFFLPTLFGTRYTFQGNRMYVPMAGIIICVLYIINGFFKNGFDNLKGKIIISTMLIFMFFNIISAVNMLNYACDDDSFFANVYNEMKLNKKNKNQKMKFINFTIRQYEAYGHTKEAENIRIIFYKDFPGYLKNI